jgi:hypothetical protein
MIEARKHCVENGLQSYDGHPSEREIQVKHHDCREEKEEEREQNRPDK